RVFCSSSSLVLSVRLFLLRLLRPPSEAAHRRRGLGWRSRGGDLQHPLRHHKRGRVSGRQREQSKARPGT
ncbi:Phosphoribosyl isomerase A, partial [Clarias magur]